MAKGKKCVVIGNTAWGYTSTPKTCNSIAEAVREGKMWFAYRIFDTCGNLIKRGFGED